MERWHTRVMHKPISGHSRMGAWGPDGLRCDQVWAGGCEHPVRPGVWTHHGHRDLVISPVCPSGVLAEIATFGPIKLQLAVASNPACPPTLLKWMSLQADPRVAASIQANPAYIGSLAS